MKDEMTPRERQQIYESSHNKLLEDLKIGVAPVIEFPTHKKIPFLSKVALRIVTLQGGRMAQRFIELKK